MNRSRFIDDDGQTCETKGIMDDTELYLDF